MDCLDGSDESECLLLLKNRAQQPKHYPAVVDFASNGELSYTAMKLTTAPSHTPPKLPCPDTHFQCPGDLHCLPVFVLCNEVLDCPGREDEKGCEEYRCPGLYRCRSSLVCLHPGYVCDGLPHCPQHDDELLCGAVCPAGCTCHGLAFSCSRSFPAGDHPALRYLSAAGSGMTPVMLKTNVMLIYLSLANCSLSRLSRLPFRNLHTLDLSANRMTDIHVHALIKAVSLKVLIVADNPLKTLVVHEGRPVLPFRQMYHLDLSGLPLKKLDPALSEVFPNLHLLNLSRTWLSKVAEGFGNHTQLHVLDLRGCHLATIPRGIFQGLDHLHTVYADNYKLCCADTLPAGFHLAKCHAPFDEVSSCGDLLRSHVNRFFLSLIAAVSVIGNLGSFVYRTMVLQTAKKSGFGTLVTHLCVADLFMGVYLAVIGVADRLYLGNYLWEDTAWRNSVTCKLAGFLCLLSSEVSAFIICVVTFDRFFVLRFPFSNVRLRRGSAHLTCSLLWIGGAVLAGVPLLPVTEHWHFYSQKGICFPLPVTRQAFPGHDYSFGIIIVLNFLLFLLIAIGQASVYASVQANRMATTDKSKHAQEVRLARRLITIALSDFTCWFPVGLLGLLASRGHPVPGEVNVALAIFVLPLNSMLNPFLYTVNTLLERRQRLREKRLLLLISKAAVDCTEG